MAASQSSKYSLEKRILTKRGDNKRLYAIYQGCEELLGSDKKQFQELEKANILQKGELYTVANVDMRSSHTDIALEELYYDERLDEMRHHIEGLNSVAFEFYQMEKGQLVEHDIYEDKRYNPYLSDELSK